jgi:hypothetical protein
MGITKTSRGFQDVFKLLIGLWDDEGWNVSSVCSFLLLTDGGPGGGWENLPSGKKSRRQKADTIAVLHVHWRVGNSYAFWILKDAMLEGFEGEKTR